MSNSQFASESLEELLVSLADGLRDAQDILNTSPSTDRFGRPVPRYQLPYLDFEINVDMTVTEEAAGFKKLRVGTVKNQKGEISSKISGRFVVVPPGEGLPLPMIDFKSEKRGVKKHDLSITVVDTNGEPVSDAAVELNLDIEASTALSAGSGVLRSARAESMYAKTVRSAKLSDAILVTDGQGQAKTTLALGSQIPPRCSVVVSAEYAQQKKQITVIADK
ncbi:hypothetical protein M3P05_17295 [Sansalvadorimonas sp. 2012CJ34-2]|uniref:Uncharacterized protein n=1 Tax=Parendozoicomonas callyspongiae TaxID=2942213 RepID=A0ABT0PL17_9GAMM|nr:hypothetical protein [Sansalvadorimonas sp. 2012CJ34-2]MCL6271676.1 hypothetical protein [Sansalvadorimonas sp. 2012CJ34-2]